MTSPAGLEVLLKWFERYPALQSNFEVIFSGGDVLSKSLVDRVRSRICSNVIIGYGPTEASLTASAPVQLIEEVQGAVGFVTPGTVVEIVDEVGTVMPSGRQGLVRVKSSFAVDRYFDKPTASAGVFRDGWFHPGDIGALEPNGLLSIAGRHDSLLNLGGDKVNPESIEAVIASFAGVTECAVFASPNDLGNKEVIALVVTSDAIDQAKLKSYCAERLAPQFMPTKFVRIDKLPRNPMGKIDRRRLTDT